MITIKYPEKHCEGFFVPDARWCWRAFGRDFCGHAVLVHHTAQASLDRIERALVDAGLDSQIAEVLSWAPRYKLREQQRGYSMHAHGLALDINAPDNAYDTDGNMDPKIVDIFERNGWTWGGRWKTKDPMHFEYRR